MHVLASIFICRFVKIVKKSMGILQVEMKRKVDEVVVSIQDIHSEIN
jgi:predicted Zn-dependent protease with MMP-like domain